MERIRPYPQQLILKAERLLLLANHRQTVVEQIELLNDNLRMLDAKISHYTNVDPQNGSR